MYAMTIMHELDEGPSLDLLRCFVVLHHERHLSRAAVRAGLSQPAMSRALARLREVFGDPLFVRTAHGMLPTSRADVLVPRVRAVLEAARALVSPETFDPARLVRTFVVATAGFFDAELLPPLIETLAREAPGVSITTRPVGEDIGTALASGRVDLMVGIAPSIPTDAQRTRLYEERFVCAVRRDHPGVGETLGLDAYVALSHLLVAPSGTPGSTVDTALAALGLARRVVVRLHAFPSAPAIVARSDLVLTAPVRVIAPLAEPFGLRLVPLPFALDPVPVFAAWHPRVQADPAHGWFRSRVVGVGRT